MLTELGAAVLVYDHWAKVGFCRAKSRASRAVNGQNGAKLLKLTLTSQIESSDTRKYFSLHQCSECSLNSPSWYN